MINENYLKTDCIIKRTFNKDLTSTEQWTTQK